MATLTIEQKIVKHLAKKGFLTSGGDIQRALVDPDYADYLIRGMIGETGIPDINDDGSTGEECDHQPLSNEQIKEVFDNDYIK